MQVYTSAAVIAKCFFRTKSTPMTLLINTSLFHLFLSCFRHAWQFASEEVPAIISGYPSTGRGGSRMTCGGSETNFGGPRMTHGASKIIFGGPRMTCGGSETIFGGSKMTDGVSETIFGGSIMTVGSREIIDGIVYDAIGKPGIGSKTQPGIVLQLSRPLSFQPIISFLTKYINTTDYGRLCRNLRPWIC